MNFAHVETEPFKVHLCKTVLIQLTDWKTSVKEVGK